MKFYDDMTRDEVCKAYANDAGERYGFTDHDFSWTAYYITAQKMKDEDLLRWCEIQFGELV